MVGTTLPTPMMITSIHSLRGYQTNLFVQAIVDERTFCTKQPLLSWLTEVLELTLRESDVHNLCFHLKVTFAVS